MKGGLSRSFFPYAPDYRLNPVLRKACKADIPKFCQSVLNKATDDSELEGQVISCLKLKYADQVRTDWDGVGRVTPCIEGWRGKGDSLISG